MAMTAEAMDAATLPADVAAFVAETEGERPAMPPADLRHAAAAARHRALLERKVADVTATYKAEVEELTLWRDAELQRLQAEIGRTDLYLCGALDAQREVDPSRKTLRLPHGVTVSARKVPATFRREERATSEAALVEFVGGGGSEYVKLAPHICWERLKQDLEPASDGRVLLGGAVLPPSCGVTFVPEHERVAVTVAKEGGA